MKNDREGSKLFSSGEVARAAGTTLRTVRFYESQGLIHSEDRRCGGNRCFTKLQLKKLCLILRLREADFSLQEIKKLLILKDRQGAEACTAREFAAKLDEHLACLNNKIRVLTDLQAELARMRQGAESLCNDCLDRQCETASEDVTERSEAKTEAQPAE